MSMMMEELASYVMGHRLSPSIEHSKSAPAKGTLGSNCSEESSVFSGLSVCSPGKVCRLNEGTSRSSGVASSSRDEQCEVTGGSYSLTGVVDYPSSDDDDDYNCISVVRSDESDEKAEFPRYGTSSDRDSSFGGQCGYSGYADDDSLIECTHEKPRLKSQLKLVAEVQIIASNNEDRITAMLEEHEKKMILDLATVETDKGLSYDQRDEVDELEQDDSYIEAMEIRSKPEEYNAAKSIECLSAVSVDCATTESEDIESHDGLAADDAESKTSHFATSEAADKVPAESDYNHSVISTGSHLSGHKGTEDTEAEDKVSGVEKSFGGGDSEESVETAPAQNKTLVSDGIEDSAEREPGSHDSSSISPEAEALNTSAASSAHPSSEVAHGDVLTSPDQCFQVSNSLPVSSERIFPENFAKKDRETKEELGQTTPEGEDPVRSQDPVPQENEDKIPSDDVLSPDRGSWEYEYEDPKLHEDEASCDSEPLDPLQNKHTDNIATFEFDAVRSTRNNEVDSGSFSELSQKEEIRKVVEQVELSAQAKELMTDIKKAEKEQELNIALPELCPNEEQSELQFMTLEEVEALIQEKDDAIKEARWQAARYADLGREQIISLKRQLEEIKEQNGSMVRAAVQEAFSLSSELAREQMEQEIKEQVQAVRKSYRDKIDKLKSESAFRVKAAAIEATNTTTQRLTETINSLTERLENERISALQSESKRRIAYKKAVDEVRFSNESLEDERSSILGVLELAREAFKENYADIFFNLQAGHVESGLKYVDWNPDPEALTDVENLLYQVLYCQGQVFDRYEAQREEVDSQHQQQIEQLKQDHKAVIARTKKQLEARHRSEIEQVQEKYQEAADVRIKELEANLEAMGLEKASQAEVYHEEIVSCQAAVEKLKSEMKAQQDAHCGALENSRNESERLRAEHESRDSTYSRNLKDQQVELEKLRAEYGVLESKHRKALEDHQADAERLRVEKTSQESFYSVALENYRSEAQNLREEKRSQEENYRKELEKCRAEAEQLRAEKRSQEETFRKTLQDYKVEAERMRAAANEAGLEMTKRRKTSSSAISASPMAPTDTFETHSVSSETQSTATTDMPQESGTTNQKATKCGKTSVGAIKTGVPLLKALRPSPIATPSDWGDSEGEIKAGIARPSPPPSPRFTSVRSFFENSRSLHSFTNGSTENGVPTPKNKPTSKKKESASVKRNASQTQERKVTEGGHSPSKDRRPEPAESSECQEGNIQSAPITRTVKLRKTWVIPEKNDDVVDEAKISMNADTAEEQRPSPWNLRKPPLPSLVCGTGGKTSQQGQVLDGKKRTFCKTENESSPIAAKESTLHQIPAADASLVETAEDCDFYHTKKMSNALPSRTPRPNGDIADINKEPHSRSDIRAFVAASIFENASSASKARDFYDDGFRGEEKACRQNNYADFEPIQFATSVQPQVRGNQSGSRVPIVLSSSIDSPVLSVNDSMEENRPSVVRGQRIFRQPLLSAFAPPKDTFKSTSIKNERIGSQATTAIPQPLQVASNGSGDNTRQKLPSSTTTPTRARSFTATQPLQAASNGSGDNTRHKPPSVKTPTRTRSFASEIEARQYQTTHGRMENMSAASLDTSTLSKVRF